MIWFISLKIGQKWDFDIAIYDYLEHWSKNGHPNLASLLNISPVQSTEKCSVAEDGSCQALNNLDVVKRSVVGPPIPIQDILFGLFSPSKISNQFTDVILFQTIIAVGWIVAGNFYILNSV